MPEESDVGERETQGDDRSQTAEVSPEELAKLRAERDEYLDQWRRAQADCQNLRKRMRSEVESAQRGAMEPLVLELLRALDGLELGLAEPAKSPEAAALRAGVALTRDQILAALAAAGIETMPESPRFDPNLHLAVAQGPGEPGTVLATLRRGYTWRGAVLRPAQVRVATGADAGGSRAAADEADTD